MKRIKRHKIKHEKPETSSAFTRAEEHDLAYYIHDRVELMHQVFSVIKSKDLRAMAPECVRRLSIDDLQELCTEELLGISSKRLLAVLDGAEPPSDTESSSHSSEQIEAISLDSISSDDEILSQGTKKKRKHKRRDSTKSKKHKEKTKKHTEVPEEPDKSKASRAGLTVLELLELQARARAIRAQLQQEQAKRTEPVVSQSVASSSQSTSDSDVEVKEEPAEVVEIISSDDEKPKIDTLENAMESNNKEPEPTANSKTSTTEPAENKDSSKKKKKKEKTKKKDKKKKVKDNNQKETVNNKESDKTRKESTSSKDSNKTTTENNQNESVAIVDNIDSNITNNSEDQRVTKRVNDLIITVPQHSTRKIKLNRNKMTVSVTNSVDKNVTIVENTRPLMSVVTRPEKPDEGKKISSVVSRPKIIENVVNVTQAKQKEDKNINDANNIAGKSKNKEKIKKKSKKVAKRQSIDEDHDEITLQLSDSEKMDLLENFDRRNYDNVSSTSSDSESSSSSSSDDGETTNVSKELKTTQENAEDTSKDANMDNLQDSAADVIQQGATEDNIETSNNVSEKDTSINSDVKEKNTKDFVEGSEIKDNSVATDISIQATELNTDGEITTFEDKSTSKNNDSTNVETNAENPTTDSITKELESSEKDQNPKTSADVTIPVAIENKDQNVIEISKIDDIPVQEDNNDKSQDVSASDQNQDKSAEKLECKDKSPKTDYGNTSSQNNDKVPTEESIKDKKDLSEGELTEQESSDVEASEVQPEVFCISDDETPKKKKKKDKKAKKEKKKKSDFHESADQNFYKETKESDSQDKDKNIQHTNEIQPVTLDDDIDDICEILELSDDSDCYEVEGAILSKEPTVEEIAALSAKIDEFEREEVVTEQEILIHEKFLEERNKTQEESSNDEIENISWKDRYLGSNKVKKVLNTSNILNAMRKKNKELKKKMEESKKKEQELEAEKAREEAEKKRKLEQGEVLEEGSIEHYNTLEASTKYVDPVPDPVEIAKKKEEELKEQQMQEAAIKEKQKEEEEAIVKEKTKEVEEAIQSQVTGEMKKDAKQLLSMYKKLLKYNDIKKQKDPNKKKSKKKKKKEKDGLAAV